MVVKDNIIPSAFVPPFKKIRHSSKTKEEDDKYNFVPPFTNQCAAPSTKKCTVTLTGDKPSEDIPPVTLGDTANDELVMSSHLRVSCGAENPGAEEGFVGGALSRGKQAAWSQNNKAHIS